MQDFAESSLQIFLMSLKTPIFLLNSRIIYRHSLDGAIEMNKAVPDEISESAAAKFWIPGCAGGRICLYTGTKESGGESNSNLTAIWFKRPLARGHAISLSTRLERDNEIPISYEEVISIWLKEIGPDKKIYRVCQKPEIVNAVKYKRWKRAKFMWRSNCN